jgi:hypothetical protein
VGDIGVEGTIRCILNKKDGIMSAFLWRRRETRYPIPIVPEAGWAPEPVRMGVKRLAPPTRFDHRTVQPVASCYPGPPQQ